MWEKAVSFGLSYFPDSAVHIVSTADPIWTVKISKQDAKHRGLHLTVLAAGAAWSVLPTSTDQLVFHSAGREWAVLLVKLMSEVVFTYPSASAWVGQLLPKPVSVTSKTCMFVLFGLCLLSKSYVGCSMPVEGYNNLSHKVSGEKQVPCWTLWHPFACEQCWDY